MGLREPRSPVQVQGYRPRCEANWLGSYTALAFRVGGVGVWDMELGGPEIWGVSPYFPELQPLARLPLPALAARLYLITLNPSRGSWWRLPPGSFGLSQRVQQMSEPWSGRIRSPMLSGFAGKKGLCRGGRRWFCSPLSRSAGPLKHKRALCDIHAPFPPAPQAPTSSRFFIG